MLKRFKARVIRPTTMKMEEFLIEMKTVRFMTDKSVFYRIGLLFGRWLRKCFDEFKKKREDYLSLGIIVGIVALWLGLIYYNETRVRISRDDNSVSISIKDCPGDESHAYPCGFTIITHDTISYKKGYVILNSTEGEDLIDTNCDNIPDDVSISPYEYRYPQDPWREIIYLSKTRLEEIKAIYLVDGVQKWREYKEKLGIDELIRDGKLPKPECK